MPRKLVLYSDQEIPENAELDRRMLALIAKPRPRVGYVASASEPERFGFDRKREYYAALGASLDVYFELDVSYAPEDLPALLDCDAIHLSGGNTFYFLSWLKRRALLASLSDYVAGGGVLIGASAGSILMTPEISSAALCGDQRVEYLTDDAALGLVEFQFLPHFDVARSVPSVLDHQRGKSLPLYACPDGAGIVVDGVSIELVGEVRRFDGQVSPAR